MAVTIKVNGTNLSLCHKGSGGFVRCTLPDVCKTPSPGGPVPIPYPVIVSFSKNLKNGTKTVKADGGNMIAIKGSEFSTCQGDEPGTVGGVKSSTNMKETKWILYSFDVKMDGKNACRLSDKMTMNHGNTVSLAGLAQAPVPSPNFANKRAAIDRAKADDTRASSTEEDPLGRAPKGSTAAALYKEIIISQPTKGKWHYKKARDLVNRYKNLDDDVSAEENNGDLTKGEADKLRADTTEGYVRNDDAVKEANKVASPPWPK
jgi:uncharacterized protein DUF4150